MHKRANFRFLRSSRSAHVEPPNPMLFHKRAQLFPSRSGFHFVAAQVKHRFAKSLGEFKRQSRAPRNARLDAEYNGALAVAHIPFRALRIMCRGRFAHTVLTRNNAVFGSPLSRA